ncbi:hypothetical protein BDQ17DRAFT_767735 [Cyathus striatus]|nr:hypothetical protein BDQ17DRAFT_767735 [Cyathus striatus]
MEYIYILFASSNSIHRNRYLQCYFYVRFMGLASWVQEVNFYLVVFEAVTLLQNIMLTTLIVGRLLLCRRRIRRVLGKCHGNEYIGVASMVVESQSLLGIAQVTMLVSLIDANTVIANYAPTFLQVTGQIQVLSPMILIYRVMQGKMCNSQTIAQIIQLRFNNDDGPGPSSAA